MIKKDNIIIKKTKFIICEYCNNKKEVPFYDKKRFCDQKCFFKWRIKENHPLYKKPLTEEQRKACSRAKEKNGMFGFSRYGKDNPNFGKKWSIEQREKASKNKKGNQTGDKNPNWKGGISTTKKYSYDRHDNIYPESFSINTKKCIKKRDKNRCFLCGRYGIMCVHHIDYNKNNSYLMNLITLCRSCHSVTNGNRTRWTKFFNDIMTFRYLIRHREYDTKNTFLIKEHMWYVKENYDILPKATKEFFAKL